MKKLLAVLFLLLVLFGIWWYFFRNKADEKPAKQQTLEVGKHSAEFNQSLTNLLHGYDLIKSSLVEPDTLQARVGAKKFISFLDSIRWDDLKKDSGILETIQTQLGDLKANAEAMLLETDITEMRQDFRMISENLFPFLKMIRYEGPTLYWQNCPMAFGEGKDANWISNTQEIVNPYLGKNHPEYKGTMLHCGIIKDSIQ